MDFIFDICSIKRFKMDRITSIINRFLVLYFVIYFVILTHPVQTRRSASSAASNAAASSASTGSSTSQISGSCELALRKCSKQISCGMTLHDYRLSCKQVRKRFVAVKVGLKSFQWWCIANNICFYCFLTGALWSRPKLYGDLSAGHSEPVEHPGRCPVSELWLRHKWLL